MVGEKIKKLRTLKGLTQTELAKRLYVTSGAVSQWEKGLTTPDMDRLIALAKVFGVPLDTFVEEPIISDEQDDTMEIREQLRRDPNMRVLFDAASKATPEQLKAAAAMLRAFQGDDNET